MNQKKDLRQVKSIFLTAYLITKDISPVKIIPEGESVVFLFEDTPEYLTYEQEFYRNEDIQTFLNTYRLLKAKISKIKYTGNNNEFNNQN